MSQQSIEAAAKAAAATTARENWERFKSACFAVTQDRNAIEAVIDAQRAQPSAKALKAKLAKLPPLAAQTMHVRLMGAAAMKFVQQARQYRLEAADEKLFGTIDNTFAGYIKMLDDVDRSIALLAGQGKKLLGRLAQQDEAAALAKCLKGELGLLLEADESAMRSALVELRAAQDKGWKLFVAREHKALEELRRQTKLPADLERMGRSFDVALADLKTQASLKLLAPTPRAELAAALKAMAKRRAELDTQVLECRSLKARLNDLRVVPLDLDRALQQLEIDRAHKADVERALQGSETQMQRGLDGLARKLKLKLSGRDLFGRLRKAQMV